VVGGGAVGAAGCAGAVTVAGTSGELGVGDDDVAGSEARSDEPLLASITADAAMAADGCGRPAVLCCVRP